MRNWKWKKKAKPNDDLVSYWTHVWLFWPVTDRSARNRMVFWINNYPCNQCLSLLALWVRIPFRRGVFDKTFCNKVCRQWFATDRWLSPGTPVYFINETDRHDITEILLNALNTIAIPLFWPVRFNSLINFRKIKTFPWSRNGLWCNIPHFLFGFPEAKYIWHIANLYCPKIYFVVTFLRINLYLDTCVVCMVALKKRKKWKNNSNISNYWNSSNMQ